MAQFSAASTQKPEITLYVHSLYFGRDKLRVLADPYQVKQSIVPTRITSRLWYPVQVCRKKFLSLPGFELQLSSSSLVILAKHLDWYFLNMYADTYIHVVLRTPDTQDIYLSRFCSQICSWNTSRILSLLKSHTASAVLFGYRKTNFGQQVMFERRCESK